MKTQDNKPDSKNNQEAGKARHLRIVRHFGMVYVASLGGKSAVAPTAEKALSGLNDCLFPYYVAECPECGWVDTSEKSASGEHTGGDDYNDAICPKCFGDPESATSKNVVIDDYYLPNKQIDNQ